MPVHILEKRFRFDPLTFVRLRRLLHQNQPDVVQSFLFSANSYVRFPGVCPSGSKIVVAERCVDSWKSGWQLRIDRWLSNRMDVMTANSESVAEFYRSVVGVDEQKISVISNGVLPPSTTATETANAPDLRTELGLPPDTPVLGFAGRLAPQKCLNDLVWAFHLLHQAVEGSALVLVGDGPQRDQLAEFAESVGCRSRVFFTGHRSDAAQLIPQFNAFCLPSSFEGMSNSLAEAMAAGVPVIASDIPANADLITNEETGLLVPCGESVAICKAAQRILTDNNLAKSLGEKAQQVIQSKYSVEQMVTSHIELYERMAGADR
ncbi:2-deoxystreptamine glucosyltransferase [Fuerstiella marisgermanici]|uniref:2-deoxystreptamine glucosyltransferase n=1 Tax=Fuerstiella marisgermanici TaxID=1891926 RepID=A0A1P8WJG6_9PLAN|nr:2-deoxystreptamine glucosyltransferase [Fuerstiella marisgermanici]